MAKPNVVVRQRESLWWMEEGEEDPQTYASRLKEETQSIPVKNRGLREKYDTARFQPGWSGKDAPAVEKMGSGYASSGDRNFDDLGASSGKKTSRGSVGKVTVDDIKEAKRILAIAAKQNIREEFIDDEFGEESPEENGAGPDDMDGFTGANDNDAFSDEGGLGEEDDVPPEMTDEGFEDDGGIADDVTVEIGGQRYSLEPEAPEEGEEGMGGDEFGDEGFEDEGLDGGDIGGDEFAGEPEMGEEPQEGDDEELLGKGGVKAENKDVTREKGKRVRETNYDKILDEAIESARKGKGKKITKEELTKKLIAHHLRIKTMLEKNHKVAIKALKELFTGEYVLNKQGEPGYDFSPVGGDDSFAVVARAASGDQYTPTISKSVWEPDKKGGKTGHATTVTQESDFRKWLDKMQKNLAESEKDPGEEAEAFNKNDLLDKNLSKTGGLEEYPALPELINKDGETISQYGEARNRVAARRQREAEQAIRFPSTEVKEDLEKNLKESTKFNFKDLMTGKYK